MLTSLPNLLTLSRIAAIPALVALAWPRTGWSDFAACLVFSLAAATDWLDGHLARARNQTSRFGRMLDPIADKLLVGAALMLLAGLGGLSSWGLLPAIVIMLREILVSGLREFLAGLAVGMPVTSLAKWKTGCQMTALGMLLAGDGAAGVLGLGWLPVSLLGEALLWLAALLTIVTGWDYLRAALGHAMVDEAAAAQGQAQLVGKTVV
jgi:cardiolipin synthase